MRARAGLAAGVLLGALVNAPAQAVACIHLPQPLNGVAALKALGPDLSRAAAKAGTTPETLRQTLRTDSTLWLDTCARPYFVEPAEHKDQIFEPALDTGGDALTLHSRPGSKRTIYLDFDGVDVTASGWVGMYGHFTAPGYSIDDDPAFDATERARIAGIWLRVAEDYAPFDVDVTTEDPGPAAIDRTDAADDVYGTRVAIIGDNPIYAQCHCGGIAYVHIFDEAGDHEDFQPAFVLTQGVKTGSKSVAEAASHEAGHTLGLYHDGTPTAAYYPGQGLWAPIMGVGYYEPLTQWSKGEYANANRTEDDLAIIAASGAPRITDDVGDTRGDATRIDPGTVEGLIGTQADTDWFSFDAADLTTISVLPQAVSPDLDARLDLYDASGNLLASDDLASALASPDIATGLDASITQVLSAGRYSVKVDGVGSGSPTDTGYSDYASLGRYELSLTTNGSPALVITRQVLPTATVDQAYSAQFSATGGTAPLSYTLGSGALPPGLSLGNDGALKGIPTVAGTYTFVVEVADATPTSSRGTFTMTVRPKANVAPPATEPPTPSAPPQPTATPTGTPTFTTPPAVRITTARHLPRGRVGKRYSLVLRADNAVSWHAVGVPKGLRVDGAGTLSGRPKKRGRFHFEVVATGSSGQSDTRTLTVVVRRAGR